MYEFLEVCCKRRHAFKLMLGRFNLVSYRWYREYQIFVRSMTVKWTCNRNRQGYAWVYNAKYIWIKNRWMGIHFMDFPPPTVSSGLLTFRFEISYLKRKTGEITFLEQSHTEAKYRGQIHEIWNKQKRNLTLPLFKICHSISRWR